MISNDIIFCHIISSWSPIFSSNESSLDVNIAYTPRPRTPWRGPPWSGASGCLNRGWPSKKWWINGGLMPKKWWWLMINDDEWWLMGWLMEKVYFGGIQWFQYVIYHGGIYNGYSMLCVSTGYLGGFHQWKSRKIDRL